MTIQITTVGITDRGRKRSRNEDQFLVARRLKDETQALTGSDHSHAGLRRSNKLLIAVADGMGGHRGGAVASEIAVKSLANSSARLLQEVSHRSDQASLLREVYRQIHQRICKAGQAKARLFGMGTTLTTALIHEDRAWIAHVGDSRAYVVRGGRMQRLTRDHTFAQLGGDSEGIGSHVLWNCLGGRGTQSLEIDCIELSLEANDHLLLCTDGLTREVPDDELAQILESSGPADAAKQLIDMANQRGGRDNITVVACEAQSRRAAQEKACKSTLILPSTPV